MKVQVWGGRATADTTPWKLSGPDTGALASDTYRVQFGSDELLRIARSAILSGAGPVVAVVRNRAMGTYSEGSDIILGSTARVEDLEEDLFNVPSNYLDRIEFQYEGDRRLYVNFRGILDLRGAPTEKWPEVREGLEAIARIALGA